MLVLLLLNIFFNTLWTLRINFEITENLSMFERKSFSNKMTHKTEKVSLIIRNMGGGSGKGLQKAYIKPRRLMVMQQLSDDRRISTILTLNLI